MKTSPTLRLLIITGILLSLAGCQAKDLTKGKDPMEIVLASCTEMQNLEAYSFQMEMKMSLPNPETLSLEDVSISGTGESMAQPQKAHLKMVTKIMDTEMPSEVYVEMENEKLVEYISNPLDSAEWLRIELPLNDEMMGLMNPAQSMAMMKEMLRGAKIIREIEEEKVKYVVIQATIRPEAIAEFIPNGLPLPQEEISKLLSSLGEFNYDMWIRKDNLLVTRLEMDMGDLMRNVLTSQKGLPPLAGLLLDKMTATIKFSYLYPKTPINITIPDGIKNQAKDITEALP